MSRIRMEEIAVKAGVSLATVSRTIHSPHLVRPETREQILQVMSKYHYVYNVTASDFSKKRSSVIGVIIPTTKGAIFSNSTQTSPEKAQERGWRWLNNDWVNFACSAVGALAALLIWSALAA